MLLEALKSFRLLLAFILGSAEVGGALSVFLSGSLNFIAIKDTLSQGGGGEDSCIPDVRQLGIGKLHLHKVGYQIIISIVLREKP